MKVLCHSIVHSVVKSFIIMLLKCDWTLSRCLTSIQATAGFTPHRESKIEIIIQSESIIDPTLTYDYHMLDRLLI